MYVRSVAFHINVPIHTFSNTRTTYLLLFSDKLTVRSLMKEEEEEEDFET